MATTRSIQSLAPLSVGRFALCGKVGPGRLGAVHRGRDELTEQLVTIHLLDSELVDKPGVIEKLRDAFQSAMKSEHPNVLRLLDFGQERGRWFLISESVDGISLAQMIDAHSRIAEESAIRIVTQVAQAIDYLHRSGSALPRVRPANVLIRNDGVVKLVAFEPALQPSEPRRRPKSPAPEGRTSSDLLSKTVSFGEALRSLGATLYEAVTGQEWVDPGPPPPPGTKRVRSRSSRSRQRIAGLSERVERAVRWATDHDPARQPISAAEWLKLLRSKSRAPATPRPDIRPGGTEADDRRASVRYSVGVGSSCTINTSLFGDDPERDPDLAAVWPLVVRDVSSGGIGILLARRCEPGTELAIELDSESNNSPRCLPVRVVRVRRDSMGHWIHGCEFHAPLTAQELSSVLYYLGRVEPS